MLSQTEIEAQIREAFPLVLANEASVDVDELKKNRNELATYATDISEPVLRPETIRYQSIMLYSALVLLSVSLLRIGHVKVLDTPVEAGRSFLIAYSSFIGAVAVVFLCKAYVDFERLLFVRERNAGVTAQLRTLLSIGRERRVIQHYFWSELQNAIGRTYSAHNEAMAPFISTPSTSRYDDVNYLPLNLAALGKIPRLAMEIDAQQANLERLSMVLAEDKARHSQAVALALSEADPQEGMQDEFSAHLQRTATIRKMQDAFQLHLQKWFDARNELSSESIRAISDGWPENKSMERVLRVLQSMRSIRIAYTLIEVTLPSVFVLGSVIYVWTSDSELKTSASSGLHSLSAYCRGSCP